MVGKITYLAQDRGYGFIQSDEYEKNLFFHAKNLKGTAFENLNKGDEVSFDEVIQTEKGMSVKEVQLV